METSEHLCSEAPTEPTGETSPESVHTPSGLWIRPHFCGRDCGGHNPMLVTVVDVVTVFSVFVLPVCLNVVFLCLPRSLTAALFRSLCYARGLGKTISHPAGHSVLTGFRATKKPAHKCVPTPRKRIDLSFAVVASHSCNRLCYAKSKLSFTLFRLLTVGGSFGSGGIFISIPQALSG